MRVGEGPRVGRVWADFRSPASRGPWPEMPEEGTGSCLEKGNKAKPRDKKIFSRTFEMLSAGNLCSAVFQAADPVPTFDY